MFTFLKKVLGFDNKTMADAGVQIEQTAPKVESAPYKVPEPAATTPIPLVVEPVVEVPAPKAAPAKKTAPAKTPAQSAKQKPRGRKPAPK